MRDQRAGGFTLVELLVAVALIGILAAAAFYYLGGQSSKAKAGEVYAVFAAIRDRQEVYKNEWNVYHSTTTNDTVLHPTPLTSSKRPVAPLPQTWLDLRLGNLPNSSVYCAYGTVAGPANGGTVGTRGTSFGFTAQPRNWYYIVAECDFDGNSGTNAEFFTHSGTTSVLKRNEKN